MTDIIAELKEAALQMPSRLRLDGTRTNACTRGADEIKRLLAEVEALRALLREARINLDPLPQMYGEDGEDEASEALAKLCSDIDAALAKEGRQ